MKTKYYTGPGGVFYHPIIDELVIMIKSDEGSNDKKQCVVYEVELKDVKYKAILIEIPKHLIRLSDL